MDRIFITIGITIALLIFMIPALLFFRKSTDIHMDGDLLTLKYPFSKEVIRLSTDLKHWNLQEVYFLRMGKIYAINIELANGKRKTISSRFNADSFQKVLLYLRSNYSARREPDER